MPDEIESGRGTEPEEPQPSLLSALWRALQSVRTTIYLIVILAVATTIGGVIPQERLPEYYQMIYGPRWSGVVLGLGFDRLYGSTWYVVTVALLLLNLAACVGRSWRRATARYRGPSAEALSRKFESPQASACWEGTVEAARSPKEMAEALRRARYGVTVDTLSNTRTRILARRWPLAAYGGIVTHLAIFLVALGAVLGCLPWTSLDERITLTEGETRLVSDRDLALPFPVRLDDFRMEYYPETGAPSSYESDITLFAGKTEVKTGTATVNSQVRDRGVSFGQSEWGISAVRVAVRSGADWEDEITFPIAEAAGPHGESAWTLDEQDRVAFLHGNTSALVAEYFVADAFEREGEIVGSASHYPRSPAVLLTLVSGLDSGEHEFHSLGWLRPDGQLTYQDHVIRFDDIVYNSTLSVRRDPGLPLVWVGFVLISLGMIVAFYVQPRTFLVEADFPGDGKRPRIRVSPAGRQLLETDRRAIEAGCEVKLRPVAAQTDVPAPRRK